MSFVFPGLGQLYAGRRILAAIFAIPAVLVTLLVLWECRHGLIVLVARFFDPRFALAAVALVILVGWLRVAVVVHAFLCGERSRAARRRERGVLAALLVAIFVMHSAGALYAWSAYEMDTQIFGGSDFGQAPDPSVTPDASGNLPSFIPAGTLEPAVTPPPGSTRITILITGVDSYVTRQEVLNDTLMLVSVDTATRKVAMISVPRDTAGYPLYWGGSVTPTTRINSLVTSVRRGRIESPDAPMTTLAKEIGYLVGIDVNYYAVLDLAGFVKLIDKVGGVCLDNPSVIDDASYDWLDGRPAGFHLEAGQQCLNGENALAYVRSRHGVGNNDYKRSSRQQQVLVALERKLAGPGMVLQLPDIMKLAGSMIRTNFPASQVADMVALSQDIPADNITNVVLGPPYSLGNSVPESSRWVSCLKLDKVAELSVELFGEDSRYFGKTQKPTCGI
jgi:LCP family protein required for cell wall assembly